MLCDVRGHRAVPPDDVRDAREAHSALVRAAALRQRLLALTHLLVDPHQNQPALPVRVDILIDYDYVLKCTVLYSAA